MSKEKRHERMKFIDENSSIHTTEELIASRFYLMGLEYTLEEIEKSLPSDRELDYEFLYSPLCRMGANHVMIKIKEAINKLKKG